MPGKPQNPKDISDVEKRAVMAKSAALKDLGNHPGWPVFVDILASAIEHEEKIDNIDVSDTRSDAAIGRDVKLKRAVLRRLRIVKDNVVSLVEKGDNYRRIEKLKSRPGYILQGSLKRG